MIKTEETGDFCAGANLARSEPSTARHQFQPPRHIQRRTEKKLFIGLEEGSFQSFLVVNLEYLATQAERMGSTRQLDWGAEKARHDSSLPESSSS